jgi:putative hemolysin
MNKSSIFVTALGVIAFLGALLAVYLLVIDYIKPAKVATFEECESAGYAVIASTPEQCQTPDGKIFIKAVSLVANPASAYCEERGGYVEIRTNMEGEAGFCLFEDGSECDEWDFFRGVCLPGQSKADIPFATTTFDGATTTNEEIAD